MSIDEANDRTPATASVPGDEPRIPHLVALNGPEVGSVFRLTRPKMIVGAGSAADIRLAHETVSRRHLRLSLKEDGTVWIDDLGSTNGTFVGVDRVQRPTLVPDGSNIGLGTFVLLRLTHSPVASEILSQIAHARPKLNTRNYLLDLVRAEHAYARRHATPLTLVFVRADAVSSRGSSGADIRDEAMGVLGTEIDSAIRTEDFLARSGQDEFAILIRGTGDDAETLAERVRARVESWAVRPGSAPAFHTVTAVVIPIRAVGLQISSGAVRGPAGAEDILSTARALAGPAFQAESNTVVRIQTLVI